MSASNIKPLKLVLKDIKDPHSASSLKHIKPVIVSSTRSVSGFPDINSPMSSDFTKRTSDSASPKKKVIRIGGRRSEMNLDINSLRNSEFQRNDNKKHAAATVLQNKHIPFNIFKDKSLTPSHKKNVGTLESLDHTPVTRTGVRSFTQRDRDPSLDSPKYRNMTQLLAQDNSPKKVSIVLHSNVSLPPIDWSNNAIGKEDSKERLYKVQKLVKELEEERYIVQDYLNYKQNQKLLADETERVVEIAETILPVMNLTVRSKMDAVHDSVMVIHPIEDRNNLADFYRKFIPILCHLPFGFLSRLRISVVTVCQQVDLFSPNYLGILEQKLLNGLFIIKRLSTREHVRDHWYRIVLYHFIKKKTGFYDEWKSLWAESQARNKADSARANVNSRQKPTAFSDLLLTFKRVMAGGNIRGQEDSPTVKELAEFLKDHLAEFDPSSFAAEEDEENNNFY